MTDETASPADAPAIAERPQPRYKRGYGAGGKKPGRPTNAELAARRGAADAARNPAAPVQRPVREPVVSAEAHGRRRASAVGRDGKLLSRTRAIVADPFHVPRELVPDGWDYQWNPHEVLGMPFSVIERNMALAMHQNGWTPVPAGRHPGMWMPHGTPPNSAIVLDGLRLDERPKVLTEEARRDDFEAAVGQVRAKIDEYSVVSKSLPDGFTRDNQRLRAMERQQTNSVMAPAPDAPRPVLEIDPT